MPTPNPRSRELEVLKRDLKILQERTDHLSYLTRREDDIEFDGGGAKGGSFSSNRRETGADQAVDTYATAQEPPPNDSPNRRLL